MRQPRNAHVGGKDARQPPTQGELFLTDRDPTLTVAILDHEHWRCAVRQAEMYCRQDRELFERTRWLLIHNGDQEAPLPAPNADGFPSDRVEVHRIPNRGYGAGINYAQSLTQSPFLLALNSDLAPEPGFLSHVHRLIDQWRDDDRIGIVGFRLLNPDGSLQGSVGRFPTLSRILLGQLRPRRRRKYVPTADDRPSDVDWATGASILLSRTFLEEVGTFDERFFMYYEDVDLCRRAADSGWKTRYDPRAAMKHYYPYHTRPLTYRMVYAARHGLLTYFAKHRPKREFRWIRRIALAECAVRERSPEWNKVREMIVRYRDLDSCRIAADDLP